jgi:CelD/BcsL family acetyltransferase involved in cellulose biosynthesis
VNAVPQTVSPIRLRVDTDLRTPLLTVDGWRAAAVHGDTSTVFQELHWLRSWWDVYGRGELLIISAWCDRSMIAAAPLFVDGGMVFFVGSGGSDYLDFIGDAAQPGVMKAILTLVLERVPGLLGFRLYHVPDASRTGNGLREAATQLDLDCFDEGELAAPVLDLGTNGVAGLAAAQRASMLRHERAFRRTGMLSVRHLRRAADIQMHLDTFFDQHQRRWQATEHPSLFRDPAHRAFYRRLTEVADDSGWLRFTLVEFDGRPIAFHFGFSHRGTYLWYKPSFEIELARRSPGEVLLRHLLLAAVQEEACIFDFGLGDEAFKHRFSSRVPLVRTWGLYPRK